MSRGGHLAAVSVVGLCGLLGYSPQAYYRQRRNRQRQAVDESKVLDAVHAVRARHPRLGSRKLLHLIQPELAGQGIRLGRDRFIALLGRAGLLVQRRRRVRTTDSRHGFRRHPNLLADGANASTGPHQVLVGDLTYVDTLEGFLYLALLTDAYSRKIVGYDISDSLEAVGCQRALQMAARQLPSGSQGVIHHTDQGIQYCCTMYTAELAKLQMWISTTQDGNCYDNAMAERVNGILKEEYLLGGRFASKAQAKAVARQSIGLYNDERPHLSLNYATPSAVHIRTAG